eukprot:ANDGO_07829.mRNA.1 axonemal
MAAKDRAKEMWEQLKRREQSKVTQVGQIYQSQRAATSTVSSNAIAASSSIHESAMGDERNAAAAAGVADDPAMHISDFGEVVKYIARDINCFTDADRAKRRASLQRVHDVLDASRNPNFASWSAGQVSAHFLERLLKPTLEALQDTVEKCRELAVGILASYVQSALVGLIRSDDPSASFAFQKVLSYMVPVFLSRLGSIGASGDCDAQETSEEVRVKLLAVFVGLVDVADQESLKSHMDEISSILRHCMQSDPFPEIKLQGCMALENFAHRIGSANFTLIAATIVPSLQSCVSHSHSKVRVQAVKAIGCVIRLGLKYNVEPWEQSIRSMVRSAQLDKTLSVRSELVVQCGLILEECVDWEYLLLPFLLFGVEFGESACERCAQILDALGERWVRFNEKEVDDILRYRPADADPQQCAFLYEREPRLALSVGAHPVSVRPPIGSRSLVQQHFRKFYKGLLADVEDWTAERRVAALRTLAVCSLFIEDHATEFLEAILPVLSRSILDGDQVVRSLVELICRRLGFFVPPRVYLGILAPRLPMHANTSSVSSQYAAIALGDILNSSSSVSHVASSGSSILVSYVTLIRFCLSGTSPHHILCPDHSSLDQLMSALALPDVCRSTDSQVLSSFADLLAYLASRDEVRSVLLSVFHSTVAPCIVWLLYRSEKLAVPILQALHMELSEYLERNVEVLYDHVFRMLATSSVSHIASEMHMFEAFVRNLHGAVIIRLWPRVVDGSIMTILSQTSERGSPKFEPRLATIFMGLMRRCFSALVEVTSSHADAVREILSSRLLSYCKTFVFPNCFWRPGGAPSTALRREAVAVLSVVVQHFLLADQEVFKTLIPDMISVLVSVLDDDEDDLRKVGTDALWFFFQAVLVLEPFQKSFSTVKEGLNRLEYEQHRSLFEALLKRLDDPSNATRISLCAGFIPYLDVLLQENDTARIWLETIVDTLLIHLDDPDHEVQQAVLPVLRRLAVSEPDLVAARAREARSKHRSPMYLDQIIPDGRQLSLS